MSTPAKFQVRQHSIINTLCLGVGVSLLTDYKFPKVPGACIIASTVCYLALNTAHNLIRYQLYKRQNVALDSYDRVFSADGV